MKTPWRLRILLAILRGFLRNPWRALCTVASVNIEMVSVYRFKLGIHGKDMLWDFMEASTSLGMRPFLMWGTLLGYIREGDFLKHDYDIDLGLLAQDYDKKEALVSAMTKRGYRVRHDVPYALSFETKDCLLHLDVDLLYPFKGELITSMSSEKTGELTAHRFLVEDFETLEKKIFPGDIPVWVPGRAEHVLEMIYGEWRKPIKSYSYKQGPHNQIKDPKSLGIGKLDF